MMSIDDVRAAAQRIEGVAHRTPVVTSAALDAIAGRHLFLKCENFQRVGAFKFRGAYNALSRLSDDERARGVVAFSSGNHAQGVALAAKLLGIRATIVMPEYASQIKLEATRGYGADVVTYKRGESREAIAERIKGERGGTIVPPFDHPDIIAGQGTAALELLEDVRDLEVLVTPVGGGGLISGSAIVAKTLRPGLKIVGVEPEAGDDWSRSRRARKPVAIPEPDTIAEGLRTTSPGDITWPIADKLVDDFVTVNDDEIRNAMRLLFGRTKIVVEPAGAVPVAAALAGKAGDFGARVGIIISGGNVDADTFAKLIAAS
ncbi:MAG TPA: pyridoxal-phosphate dependent enzyme [Candidatus Eremiobacteraceae bacterium]|nr:pyridoxal-phosphate dependent enzyme [Candidatus Eremiobacteraceae bacterium]